MREHRTRAAREAQLVVAETAYELRRRLRACRRYVSCTLNDYAGQRRGAHAADAISVLTDAMLDSGSSVADVAARFARIGERVATAQLRDRAG